MTLRWRRLSDHAIQSDAGHEIYRRDGRYRAWGAPGSFLERSGHAMTAALQRDLEALGFTDGADIELSASRDARACLGVFETADEAKRACQCT